MGKDTTKSGRPGAAAPFRGKPPFRPKKLKTALPRPAPPAAPLPARKSAERVAKVIARAGLCSRREAEQWITQGRVRVNGPVITSPALNVRETDKIMVDGAPLPLRERTRLFLYYKPRGLVTTNSDPEGRPTIFAALPKNLPRLISVGRLDLNTEGLLLLTNDGGLARVLELPETGWLRRYRVRAHGRVTQPELDALRSGVEIAGVRYGAIEAALDREQGANIWLTFAIREGKNREVRNVLEHLGLQVNRLIRISYGPFQLGEMREGAVEEARTRMLRDQLGERIAALAGADFAGPISSVPPLEGRAAEQPERAREAGWGRGKPAETSSPTRPASPATLPRWGRDKKKARPSQDDGAKTGRKRITRSDTIADRHGRAVPVTRTRTEKPERPATKKHRGKPHRPDRSRGPRPSRPR
ncbi:MAG: rRNA synthase [Alphaproteobacteria bacterium]|jgi:23S rRNA pseudouridine2605 synthase|nr:rRNA synthase [Alphaproteobacteria bacterium]